MMNGVDIVQEWKNECARITGFPYSMCNENSCIALKRSKNCWEFGGKALPCAAHRMACIDQKCPVYEKIVKPDPVLCRKFQLEADKVKRRIKEQQVKESFKKRNPKLWACIQALMKAVDMKHPPTAGHSQQVAEYTWEILRVLPIAENEKRKIYLSAFLHDVGKIGIPEEILNASDHLTEDSWEIIKQHPINSYKLVWPLQEIEKKVVQGIVDIVQCHHERWDGEGYPHKLAGASIPLGARILAIADSFDAMTSLRRYRGSRGKESREVFTPDEAKANLKEHPGYDPNILHLALDML